MDRNAEALGRWLEAHADRWRTLEARLDAMRGPRGGEVAPVVALMSAFRGLGRDLSLAARLWPGSRVTRYLEALFARSYDTLHRPPGGGRQALSNLLREQVPADVRALRNPILASLALMIGSALIGWLLVATFPELARLFASETMIEEVEQGRLWTDGLLNIVPSSVLSVQIMTNNIVVTCFAFAMGALYGLGTLYIIGLNGLMLGGIFAFTHQHGLAGRLFEFIVAHGCVELSVIVLAGAAGMRLGEALVRPGDCTRAEAFRAAVAQAGRLVMVGAPFLVGAGLIEGHISPNDLFTLPVRLAVGISYWLVFAAVMGGALSRRRRLELR